MTDSSADTSLTPSSPHSGRVLIFGSGIAGLFTALKLAEQGVSSTIITKTDPEEGSTVTRKGHCRGVVR